MRRSGNSVQWTNGYPQKHTVESDVSDGCFYLICLNGRIVACFCMRPSPEPTYAKIYNGQWPDNEPYNVIHRLASDGTIGGIALLAINFALAKGNLRIDTHEQIHKMRHYLCCRRHSAHCVSQKRPRTYKLKNIIPWTKKYIICRDSSTHKRQNMQQP